MRKTIVNTKVSVKLRKSEYAEEWYVYLEAIKKYVSMPTMYANFVSVSSTTTHSIPTERKNLPNNSKSRNVISSNISKNSSPTDKRKHHILLLSTGEEYANYLKRMLNQTLSLSRK